MLGIPIFFSKKYYENIAKERGLQNYKKLKKADLIKLLNMGPEIPDKTNSSSEDEKSYFGKTNSSSEDEKKSRKTNSSSESYLKY